MERSNDRVRPDGGAAPTAVCTAGTIYPVFAVFAWVRAVRYRKQAGTFREAPALPWLLGATVFTLLSVVVDIWLSVVGP